MLSRNQIRFIGHLMSCGKITDAIRKTGISSSTAYAWMKEPEFKAELQKQKTEMLSQVCTTMQIGFSDAVEELLKIIRKEDTADQVKINAIDCLFRNTRPILEDVGVLQVIEDLKRQYEKINDG